MSNELINKIADSDENIKFCHQLLTEFKILNIESGINIEQSLWLHSRIRELQISINGESRNIDALNMALSGDIITAYVALSRCQPDDMTKPFHWLTQERIDWLRNKMAEYLGWA